MHGQMVLAVSSFCTTPSILQWHAARVLRVGRCKLVGIDWYCVLAWRCGLAGIHWYPLKGMLLHSIWDVQAGRVGTKINTSFVPPITLYKLFRNKAACTHQTWTCKCHRGWPILMMQQSSKIRRLTRAGMLCCKHRRSALCCCLLHVSAHLRDNVQQYICGDHQRSATHMYWHACCKCDRVALCSRLLHAGAHARDIVHQYVATIRVLREIDPSGEELRAVFETCDTD
eukprot:1158484-Pelagomonas_calceolata.AAC.1